ncbi:BlaI/MecI/CopY family transcriptional regulator [Paraglaciecola aquimarina]|uniref:BlaI/MecI/CopY family transcriptional regulator n=1 Tax=Paraglaciecola algarum TaxID=3050085 RepID=A0ABS9D6C4_9ALTE|nr:BlaI/MecI/CopY family transcriptional regulator [Paraglaciecola sp. G1-23]MCF2948325.1 BlaI/MecI/CopY family transcriptional regulator [Paraglaciecola sp. G1-23]
MITPTPAELEILNILWALQEATTQTVNSQLNTQRKVGYTTTLKTMQVMTEKGLLDRRKEGKSHIYFPIIQESSTKEGLLSKFIDNTFGGSTSQMMMQLIGKHKVNQDELSQIKTFLKNLEDQDHG